MAPVGGDIDAVVELLEQPRRDLLIDAVVVHDENAEPAAGPLLEERVPGDEAARAVCAGVSEDREDAVSQRHPPERRQRIGMAWSVLGRPVGGSFAVEKHVGRLERHERAEALAERVHRETG